MAKTLSEDLRGRVIVAVEGGARRSSATACFGIAATIAVLWLRLWREAGVPPTILTGSARGSTSRWSGRPAGVRRFVQGDSATRPRRTRRAIAIARLHSHWRITTRNGALWLQGMITPMRLDGVMNGGAIPIYVEQVLAAEAADR